MSVTRAALALWLSWAACGCAIVTTKEDYRAYRRVQVAAPGEARLRAMRAYTSAHPDGAWAAEIEARRRAQDTETYERGRDSTRGLRVYLELFPDGAFAAQARKRQQAVALVEERETKAAAREAEQRAARRLREATLRRTWVSRFSAYWLGTLSALRGFGEPIAAVAEANPEFSLAFGRSPRPRCSERECVKYYDAEFAVPVPGGTRLERRMRLLLRLRIQDGVLRGAELLLPDQGFSRWYEQERQVAVVTGDHAAREAAIAWALTKLRDQLLAAPLQGEALGEVSPPPIEAPGIDPTGALIDTSVESPAAPPNVIAGARAPDAPPAEAQPGAPIPPPQAGPDMVLGGLQIGEDGRATELPADAPAAGGEGGAGDEVMVLDALSIPADGASEAAGEDGPPAAEPAAAEVVGVDAGPAPRAEAFRIGGLRVELFSGAGPGGRMDGLRILPIVEP